MGSPFIWLFWLNRLKFYIRIPNLPKEEEPSFITLTYTQEKFFLFGNKILYAVNVLRWLFD